MAFFEALKITRGPAAAFAAMGAVWGGFMATMPDIKAALAVDDGTMGQLLLWGSLTAIAMMSLTPRFGGMLGRAALPLGTALMGGALALQALGSGAWLFVLALMAMGGSTGALDVLMNARVGTLEARTGRSLMNLNHAVYSLAFALSAVLAGVARASGWGVAEIVGAIAAVVLALAALSIERDGIIEGLGQGARGSLRVPLGLVPWLAGVLILIGLMTENSAEAWSALYIERDLGGAVGAGSLAPALMGLTMGLGRLAGQGLASRLGEARMLRHGLTLAALGVIGVAAAQGPLQAYAGFVVMGLGVSVVVPTALSVIGRLTPAVSRGRAIARATVVGYVGYFLGPPLLGLIAELAGLRFSYVLIAGLLLAGLAVAALLLRQDR